MIAASTSAGVDTAAPPTSTVASQVTMLVVERQNGLHPGLTERSRARQ
jgi:hypothetical protein